MNGIFRICVGIFCVFLLVGCASKKEFVPKKISGEVILDNTLPGNVLFANRSGAVLSEGTIISKSVIKKLKFSQTDIKNGAQFFGENDGRLIFSKNCDEILVWLEKTKKNIVKIPVTACPILASAHGNLLAFVLVNGGFGIYDFTEQRIIFQNDGIAQISSNALFASPLVSQNEVIFALPDGKVSFVKKNPDGKFILQKTQNIDNSEFFPNAIFLQRVGKSLVIATPKKLVISQKNEDFSADLGISDLILHGEKIYVFTTDGEILELDFHAKILRRSAFPHAILGAPIIANDAIFAITQNGFLIRTKLKDFSREIFVVKNEFNKHIKQKSIFYTKNHLFYDFYMLDLRQFLR